jgi:acylphosphatase
VALCAADRGLLLIRRLIIYGRVQGVFYRGWSEQTARALGLNGWVRNRRDGSVEMLIAGAEDAVEAMIARSREGPPAARVERIEVMESDEAAPAGFEARPTL